MLKSFAGLLLLLSFNIMAQTRQYEIYFDVDSSIGSGCQVLHAGLPDINGIESRLTIQTNNQPPNIVSTTLHQCVASVFDAGVAITPAALGFNTGDFGEDVFEAVLSQAELNIFNSATVRVYFATGSSSAEDVVLVQASGDPILLGFLFPIPTLGILSILFLILAVFLISRFKLSKPSSVMIVLLAVSPAVWAMHIIIDGQTGDWFGLNPSAIDPTGDTSQPGSFADITSVYAINADEMIYLRMDIVDLENQAPIANDGLETTLEDTMVTLIMTGSDADSDPITFNIDTPPISGTLSAITVIDAVSSSVDYTPNGDFFGSDVFTFVANDGQADSAPANFEITVDAINDPPSFTTGGDVDLIKDTGPYNQIWATAVTSGPANESSQSLTFNITANDNGAIFTTLPSIDPTGVLSFEGNTNISGVANITVELQDDGGVLNGGNDTSVAVNFSITLIGVNDEPSFTVGVNQTVLEDAAAISVPAWATGISAGPPDEAGQVLTFIIDNNSNPSLFSAGPAVAADGTLTYSLSADANGSAEITLHLMDDGGTAGGGDDASPTQMFTINVTPVNDVPSFTLSGNETVLEDAGAQTSVGFISDIAAGPLDESGQTVLFNITNNSNMALFAVQPGIDSSGTLSYTPVADTVGTATITIELIDDGGTANGGVDTSATQMFDIIITEVNDEPSFTAGADQTVLEDAGAQSVVGWATGISAGPASEAGQILTFNITNNTNMALFSVNPTVAANGTLNYTPATNANGSADITIELMDDGGTAGGGDDTSPSQTFSINVTAVNDEPAFTVGATQTVLEDSSAQMVNGFITGISAGPADESGQTVSLNITGNTAAGLFSAGPSIDGSGNLSYTPVANASGSATITVEAMDNGGTADGGDDTSPGQMFIINLTGVNDAPSFTAGANPAATDEDTGAQSQAWASAILAGPANESGQILSFNLAQTSIDPTLSFSSGPTINITTGNVEYTAAANAHGSVSYNVVLMDNGGTANGGIDTTSPAVVLTLTINPINDPPAVTGTPMAQAALGNVSISVAQAQGLINTISISDVDGAGAQPFSISGAATPGTTNFMSTNGGDVSINATTGSYSYNPPAGFTGADTFDYFVCDSGVPGIACSTAITTTVTMTGLIWFVDNAAAAGGDGRLSAPFDDFGGGGDSFNANAADDPNNVIFITRQGAYAGGVTLLDGQQLVGSGATTDILTVTGLSLPPSSVALPAFTGIRPVVSGNGSNGITLGSGNTVRGLDFGNSNTMISGTNFGILTLSEVILNGTGRGLSLDTGTATATFDSISSSNSTSEGISLDSVSGSFTVSGLTAITDASGIAVNIQNTPASYTFGDVTVNNRGNAGVLINGLTGGQQTGLFGAVTINNQNGSNTTAFGIDNIVTAGSTITINSVVINNNGSNSSAIALSNNDGATINIQAGSVQNAAGAAVSISNSGGSATYAGTISNTAGRSVRVQANTAGTTTFSGDITDSGTGVFVNNNTGATVNFSGTLDLDTTTNTAFRATAGGTINASNANSTINNSTGTGVNINATTIGGSGVTFRSISVNGATNGIILSNSGSGSFTVTGDGSNTRNGSGGTIQNTTGDGVALTNAFNVSLSSMNLLDIGNSIDSSAGGNNLATNDHAVQSQGGGSISLSGVFIRDPAAGGWEAVDLSGVNAIDNDSRIQGVDVSNMQALEVRNMNVNMPMFIIDNSEFADQGGVNGSAYVLFQSNGSADMTINMQNNSLIEQTFGMGIQANSNLTGTVTFTVTDSTLRDAVDGTVGVGASGGLGGLVAAASQGGRINYDINNNIINDIGRPLVNGGVITMQAIGGNTKILDGRFDSNNIERIGYPTAAVATTTVGHRVVDVVTENNITFLDHEADMNTIDDTSREAFYISSRDASADFDVSLTNNMLGQSTAIGTTNREAMEILSEDSSDMEINIDNNMIRGNTSALDQVVDIDTENTSSMDIRFNNNTVTNLQAGGGREIVMDTESGTSSHCLQFTGNTAVDVEFDVNGAHNIEDFANRMANNPGVTNFLDGAGVTDVGINTCQQPDF